MIYLVRDNWQGRGYRVYASDSVDDPACVQIDGEIYGAVYRTIAEAVVALRMRFGPSEPIYRFGYDLVHRLLSEGTGDEPA